MIKFVHHIGSLLYNALKVIRLWHLAIAGLLLLLAWDLYPLVHLNFVKSEIEDAFGKRWPEVETEFQSYGLKRNEFMMPPALAIVPTRSSLIAECILSIYIEYDLPDFAASTFEDVAPVLSPTMYIELGTSDTLKGFYEW